MARIALRLGLLYLASGLLGFVLFVGAFQVGLLRGVDILFYRGLVLVGVAAALTFVAVGIALHRWAPSGLGLRDAFSASVLSLAFNLTFLVVVPVTVDRSISIFLLGEMAARGDEPLTPEAARALFKTVYVDAYRQIDRRFQEQSLSGNIDRVGDGYTISRRGLLVIEVARATAWLFDSHAGLVLPADRARRVARQQAARQ